MSGCEIMPSRRGLLAPGLLVVKLYLVHIRPSVSRRHPSSVHEPPVCTANFRPPHLTLSANYSTMGDIEMAKKYWRANKHLKKQYVADLYGVDRPTLSRQLRGRLCRDVKSKS
jgi:hypothetical protein